MASTSTNVDWPASFNTIPAGWYKPDHPEIGNKDRDAPWGIVPSETLAHFVVVPENPKKDRRYAIRERWWLAQRMMDAGYWPFPRTAQGLLIWGGEWAEPGQITPKYKRDVRDLLIKFYSEKDDWLTSDADRFYTIGVAIYLAWQRFNEIGGYKGPILSGMTGAEPLSMEDLFYKWAGPPPEEAQPPPWYVRAWPIWAALGLYLLSGRR